jgi:hypothetical protein
MPTTRSFLLTAVVLCMALGICVAEDQTDADPYEPVGFLVGSWKGEGTGMGGISRVTHTYEYVIQDNFLHMRTRSEFQSKEKQDPVEVHEDWSFFSYDPDREKLILRQFLSERYVNTYVLNSIDDDGKTMVFTTVSAEGAGGMGARITYRVLGPDRYELTLDLAPPGQEFFSCRRLRMARDQQEGNKTQ